MFIYTNVRCLRVVDGDTIDCAILLTPDSLSIKKRIRLARIDTPEMHQEGGHLAKNVLVDMIQNKKVNLDVSVRDSFGRWVAEVYFEEENVSDRMLEAGLAKIWRR
tara:strand:- start:106 stop:423 length:318 start_codon:yes stop_codon:yes gene_type:complete